jgi:deoxycytidine triphosphate deaminase
VPPGSNGPLILEASNNGPGPVRLYPDMKVVKALFIDISGDGPPNDLFKHLSLIVRQI